MPELRPIDYNKLIGHTIEHVEFLYLKSKIIFQIKDNIEIVIILPKYLNNKPFFTKNRKPFDYNTIKDLRIKDIGYDSLNCMFIVSTDGDIYRVKCVRSEIGFGISYFIYNHTQYKKDKLKQKQKREMFKYKVLNLFKRNNHYVVI